MVKKFSKTLIPTHRLIFFVLVILIKPTLAWANQDIIQKTDFGRINLEDLKSNEPPLKPNTQKASLLKKTSSSPPPIAFLLKGITIKGASAIAVNELQEIAKTKIGKKVTFSELQTIANHMSASYRKAGYMLSQVIIPEQKIKNGIVIFQVIEGSIKKITIDENHLNINTDILKKYSLNIKEEYPTKSTTLERSILLANELPGIYVKSYLIPSKTETGAADLIMRVEKRKSQETFLIYDNKVDKAYGSTQVTAGVCYHYPNLIDKTQIIGRISNQKNLKLLNLAHNHFIGRSGAFITAEGQYVNAKPSIPDLILTPLMGITKTVNLMLTYPVIKSRIESLLLSISVDSADTKASGSRNFADHLRSLRFTMNSNFLDNLQGSNVIQLKLSKGLKLLGASDTSEHLASSAIPTSRSTGKSDYTKLNIELTRLQYLPSLFSLLLDLEAQYSSSSLLAAEEFAFGGYRFGRGYQNSNFLGDQGIIGKLEFRFDWLSNKPWLERIQPYLFYDVGYIQDKSVTKLRASTEAQTAIGHITATSGGFGARLFMNQHLSAQLEIAKPLSKKNEEGNKKITFIFSLKGRL